MLVHSAVTPIIKFAGTNFIHLDGERHCESKVSCPRTQRNIPGQESNPDCSIRSRTCVPHNGARGGYFLPYLSLGFHGKCVINLSLPVLSFPQIRHPSLGPPKGFSLGIQKDSQEASYFKFHSEEIFREIYDVNLKVNFVTNFADGLEKLKNRSGIHVRELWQTGLFETRLTLTQD